MHLVKKLSQMEKTNHSNNIIQYAKRHWFQLIIISFMLIVLMRKDFSFQINMNNPDNVEEPSSKPVENKQKNKKLITQKEAETDSDSGILDRFSLAFIGGGTTSLSKSEFSKIDEKTIQSYLKRFAHVAISERKKYGVPSSIILANALYHGFAGTRDMAQNGNNHFAIACSSDWNGANGNYQNKCYRQYENAWTSYRDHSLFTTTGRYSYLVNLGPTDYKSWARGLEKNGFSEFPDLEKNLIEIIEKYELFHLDFQ